jgi:predicted DNA-binding protein
MAASGSVSVRRLRAPFWPTSQLRVSLPTPLQRQTLRLARTAKYVRDAGRVVRSGVEAGEAQEYIAAMSIDLPSSVEEQLRSLAAQQGRDVPTLVQEALRQYIEGAAITDLEADAVAEAQATLLDELPDIAEWKADGV